MGSVDGGMVVDAEVTPSPGQQGEGQQGAAKVKKGRGRGRGKSKGADAEAEQAQGQGQGKAQGPVLDQLLSKTVTSLQGQELREGETEEQAAARWAVEAEAEEQRAWLLGLSSSPASEDEGFLGSSVTSSSSRGSPSPSPSEQGTPASQSPPPPARAVTSEPASQLPSQPSQPRLVLGVTATPYRLGGASLTEVFEACTYQIEIGYLIGLGHLSKV